LVGVVPIRALPLNVMVVVHVLSRLFGVSVGFHLMVFVHSLGLCELVDLTANKAGEELLGEFVGDRLA
jgi:hypothetical protein